MDPSFLEARSNIIRNSYLAALCDFNGTLITKFFSQNKEKFSPVPGELIGGPLLDLLYITRNMTREEILRKDVDLSSTLYNSLMFFVKDLREQDTILIEKMKKDDSMKGIFESVDSAVELLNRNILLIKMFLPNENGE